MRRPSARFTLLAVAVVLLVATAAPACRQRQDASATRSGIVETRHHGPGPQLIPGWVWALSPGMTVAQVSEAVGVEPYKHESQADVGEPAGDLPRVEAFSWDTEAGVVEGVFRDERSTFVRIHLTQGARPAVQAEALRGLDVGLSRVELEAACGSPGLLRSRSVMEGGLVPGAPVEGALETREWDIFDGEHSAGAVLSVTLSGERVTLVLHPWSRRER
jgi:hypothetical protein